MTKALLMAGGFFDFAVEFREDVAPVEHELTTTPDPDGLSADFLDQEWAPHGAARSSK